MTWKLEKEFRFEASHQLPHHEGKCARLHGHSWKAKLICEGLHLHESGSRTGMLIDYGDMKLAMKDLLENHLDHWHLNESTGLESPTSETLAKWIFDRVKPKLPELVAVEIEETCTSRCVYRPE